MKRAILLLLTLTILSCHSDDEKSSEHRNFRQDMRDFVIGISQKAKGVKSNFAVMPQNGIELVTENGAENDALAQAYLNAIDGNGQEDLFFGYDNDDQATSTEDSNYLKRLLNVSKNNGKRILAIDYCSTPSKMTASYQQNFASGYISFAAPDRNLTVIPGGNPYNVSSDVIVNLSQAKNFLYLVNPVNYASKSAFINAVTATNYDAIIMDLFMNDEVFTASEINQLRNKANGGKRIVICYMSIGEAEDYRYYWSSSWSSSKPIWIVAENLDWAGNFKVKYWNEDWQNIIYRNSDSYLDKILTADFDGVYLDIIDGFEYFE